MTLDEIQALHVQLIAKLIEWAFAAGYTLAWAEAYRTPQQAALNAQAGVEIAASLHTQRLAVDFILRKDGVYLTETSDYAPLGAYWKSLHPLACWGGDFSTPDGDHFSLTWMGVK